MPQYQHCIKCGINYTMNEDGLCDLCKGVPNQSSSSRRVYQRKPFDMAPVYKTKKEIKKNDAEFLFRNEGVTVFYTLTFASKNKTANNYWANPYFDCLDVDWSMILNDDIKRRLYLFNIPAHSISENQLTPRSDKPYLIDFQIRYEDSEFTDTRSGYRFRQFLKNTINY